MHYILTVVFLYCCKCYAMDYIKLILSLKTYFIPQLSVHPHWQHVHKNIAVTLWYEPIYAAMSLSPAYTCSLVGTATKQIRINSHINITFCVTLSH